MAMLGVLVALALVGIPAYWYIQDITQKKHAVLRNFPIVGHLRYFFENLSEGFCDKPMLGRSLVNISGMSFGAISKPAVRAFEIKFSQGAKPGKGGVLLAGKVTEEIAHIRGIPVGIKTAAGEGPDLGLSAPADRCAPARAHSPHVPQAARHPPPSINSGQAQDKPGFARAESRRCLWCWAPVFSVMFLRILSDTQSLLVVLIFAAQAFNCFLTNTKDILTCC